MARGELNYRDALVRRIGARKHGILLDAGTGAGAMTKALSNGLCSSVVSIDLNKQVFLHLFDEADVERVHFVQCDFAYLPFKEDVFHCIVCDLVISTCGVWKPLPIFMEFRRALKTGASLFITDYYTEKSARTKEAWLAAETSRLARLVLKSRGIEIQKSVSPESSVKQLKKAGFKAARKESINANEAQEWKKRVFREYFNAMQETISGLADVRSKARFAKRLKELKDRIENRGQVRWGWGVNYLIEATK